LRAWEPTLLELTEKSTLSFPLTLIDGTSIETVGEAANYFSSLSEEQRGQGHWTIANHVLKEPAYLKAATLSLQSALLLQGLSSDPQPLGPSSR
jgi:hypothetical protein